MRRVLAAYQNYSRDLLSRDLYDDIDGRERISPGPLMTALGALILAETQCEPPLMSHGRET
jgi:hypothetical protein